MRNKYETYKNNKRRICLCHAAQKKFPGGIKDGFEKLMSDEH